MEQNSEDALEHAQNAQNARTENDSGVYLCQWVNCIVTGPGQIKKEPQPLFKVGFGTPERPHSVAGQNPAPFVKINRWPGTTLDDEKTCHDKLKSLGWHVSEGKGQEWFCNPGLSPEIICAIVNGFIIGTQGLHGLDQDGSGPQPKRRKLENSPHLVTGGLVSKMLSKWIPPLTDKSQPSEEMKDALRTALKDHCVLPQKEKEFLRGSKIVFFACAAFGSYTFWDGKDPYEIRSNDGLKCYLDAAGDKNNCKERDIYKGGNPNGPGSVKQVLGYIKVLHEKSSYRLYVTKYNRGVKVHFDTPTQNFEWVPQYPDNAIFDASIECPL